MGAYESWQVYLDMPVVVLDRFDRSVSSDWGTATTGQVWTRSGGSASDFNVAGGVGTIAAITSATRRCMVENLGYTDHEVSVSVDVNIASNASISGTILSYVLARFSSGGPDYYFARLQYDATGKLYLTTGKVVSGGSTTPINSRTVNGEVKGTPFTTGHRWHIKLGVSGTTVRAKAWPDIIPEPSDWMMTDQDGDITTGTGAGVQFTSDVLTNLIASFDDFTVNVDKRMVDVTRYVDGPMSVTRGSTAETSGEAGGASITLNNSDQRFTPGNVNSPYFPNIRPGRTVNIRETVGPWTHDLFTGDLAFPEVPSWAQSTASAPRDQTVRFSATDLLARLDRTPPFVSTLGAHIMGSDVAKNLVAYYALGEAAASGAVNPTYTDGRQHPRLVARVKKGSSVGDLVQFGAGDTVPGDDIAGVLLNSDPDGANNAYLAPADADDSSDQTIVPSLLVSIDNELLTVVLWLKTSIPTTVTAKPIRLTGWGTVGSLGTAPIDYKYVYATEVTGEWFVDASVAGGGGWTTSGGGSATGIKERGNPQCIAIRYGAGTGLDVWVNRLIGTAAMSGSTPSYVELTSIVKLGDGVSGTLTHLQIYKHSLTGGYTHAEHLAQYEVGQFGLAGQTVDERVATIAGYVGIDAGLLDLDPCTAVMPQVSLAGSNAGDAIRNAVDTEQGLLFVTGAGKLRLLDRRTRYNV